ncbi:MAG TPA: ribosomal-processing cysteine protease Prp [Clostridia bacterium]|jgi:uncharacterized protein YsxB (DUF464 family)|nr:ribosomal-processing cysteine protease Prp [Clostridia bacterium]
MIGITVTKGSEGIECVEIKGHAGYAKYGKDIVCSAVSAIAQTALMGLMEISAKKVDFVKDDETGYLKFCAPKAESETERIKQQAILETMVLGLKDIQKGYKAFVKVEVR